MSKMPNLGNGGSSGSRRSPSSPGRPGPSTHYNAPPPPPPSSFPYNSGGYGRSQGRGYGGPSGPPVVGWTPRTPGNMRAGNGRVPHSVNIRITASSSRSTPSSGRSAPIPSPRTPDIGTNGTPSWLKGAYRAPKPHTPVILSTVPNEQNVETWCKVRLEAIRASVDGGDAIPELRKVMNDLEYENIEVEAEIALKSRRERWHATERLINTDVEFSASERPLRKINVAVQHADSKLERLKSYSEFIDNCWSDDNNENKATVSPKGS